MIHCASSVYSQDHLSDTLRQLSLRLKSPAWYTAPPQYHLPLRAGIQPQSEESLLHFNLSPRTPNICACLIALEWVACVEYVRDWLICSLGLDSFRTRKEERDRIDKTFFLKNLFSKSVLFSTNFHSKRFFIYRRIPPQSSDLKFY